MANDKNDKQSDLAFIIGVINNANDTLQKTKDNLSQTLTGINKSNEVELKIEKLLAMKGPHITGDKNLNSITQLNKALELHNNLLNEAIKLNHAIKQEVKAALGPKSQAQESETSRPKPGPGRSSSQ